MGDSKRRKRRERPKAVPVESRDAAELLRLRAAILRARLTPHRTPDGSLALAPPRTGRPSRTPQELEQLGSLYEHLHRGAGPYRPRLGRTERLDLVLDEAAAWVEYQRGDRDRPPPPSEAAWFVPDRDVPMSREGALRNVALYLDVTEAHAHDLLSSINRQRQRSGVDPLPLPPRPPRGKAGVSPQS